MLFMVFIKDIFAVNSSKRFLWMRTMADTQLLSCFLLLSVCVAATNGHLNRFKVARHRVGTSKFSLNPLKPFINLMRPDPMKAAAQRHHPKYLPPPPGMYPPMHHHPARASSVGYGMHPYRPYPSQYTRYLPPSTMSLVPPLSAAPSTLMYSTLMNDHHHSYRPLASDLQIKAVRIPSKNRRPTADSLNIADSVVRQLLDFPHQQQQQQPLDQNYPSVLVIEDPDVTSTSSQTEMVSDSLSQPSPKLVISPPVHADFASDSSADSSSSASNNNPEVFVIVSKNKNKNNYYVDEKKSSDMMSGGSKLKKYKITSAYDENGGRQVWIIK